MLIKVKNTKKYFTLTQGFLKGTFKGQLESVYKTRNENPRKVEEFKKAIMCGDVKVLEPLTPQMCKKCEELGIGVPPEYMPKKTSKKESPLPMKEALPPKQKAKNLSSL